MNARPVLSREFPRSDALWPGCLLASTAHAIFVVRAPYLAHEQSWVGRNYSIQDSAGSRATITFGDDSALCVGVMYMASSGRSLLTSLTAARDGIRTLFQGIPEGLKGLSSEALEFSMEVVEGTPVSVATAAFWTDLTSKQLTAVEPWTDVVKHGAIMLEKQFETPEAALAMWADEYAFDRVEIALTEALFSRRSSTVGAITLTDGEAREINQRIVTREGLRACRESLSGIGISFP